MQARFSGGRESFSRIRYTTPPSCPTSRAHQISESATRNEKHLIGRVQERFNVDMCPLNILGEVLQRGRGMQMSRARRQTRSSITTNLQLHFRSKVRYYSCSTLQVGRHVQNATSKSRHPQPDTDLNPRAVLNAYAFG